MKQHRDDINLLLFAFGLVGCGLGLLIYNFPSPVASALTYSSGAYGTCQYNTCSISVASNGSIDLSITKLTQDPVFCSIGSDAVTVSTHSSTGYTLSVSVPAANTNLIGTNLGGIIGASSGTAGSPTLLTGNKWGYRVDAGSFGAGPTSLLSGGSVPSLTFAGVPAAATPSYVASSNSAAANETTNVWVGICINNSTIAADAYTNELVYTAATN